MQATKPKLYWIAFYVRKINEERAPIKAFFDVHSYSQFWLYNYGYEQGKQPDNLFNIAKIANFATGAIYDVYGTEFTAGPWYSRKT